MALVKDISLVPKERPAVHEPVECTASLFSIGGTPFLQLDTYGSSGREIPGKVSQSLQFDEDSAAQLRTLLDQMLSRR